MSYRRTILHTDVHNILDKMPHLREKGLKRDDIASVFNDVNVKYELAGTSCSNGSTLQRKIIRTKQPKMPKSPNKNTIHPHETEQHNNRTTKTSKPRNKHNLLTKETKTLNFFQDAHKTSNHTGSRKTHMTTVVLSAFPLKTRD